MSLFTAILEFKGGLYISQLEADSEMLAVEDWIRSLDIHIPELGDTDRLSLVDGLMNDELVKLDGLVNVWCSSALVEENVAILNVVKTSSSGNRNE